MVLTPLQRCQLQLFQDKLVQEALHARLTAALQRRVSFSQGKLSSCCAPGLEELEKILDRYTPQMRTVLSRSVTPLLKWYSLPSGEGINLRVGNQTQKRSRFPFLHL